MKSYILKGLEKLSKQLDIEFGYTVANHNFELGLPLENALKQFFRPYFPKRYEFGSGYTVDVNENLSNQCDWIIYDSTYFSPLIKKTSIEDGVEYFPYDSVYACVEVKRTLSKNVLNKAISQLISDKSLTRVVSNPSFINPLLSYKSVLSTDVSDIISNNLVTAIYAYSLAEDFSISNQEMLHYLVDNYDYEDIPNLIAVHGKFVIFKSYYVKDSLGKPNINIDFGNKNNSLSIMSMENLVSGYFYSLLLSKLNNIFLCATDSINSHYSILKEFQIHSVFRED